MSDTPSTTTDAQTPRCPLCDGACVRDPASGRLLCTRSSCRHETRAAAPDEPPSPWPKRRPDEQLARAAIDGSRL